jgi:hypothetical protein
MRTGILLHVILSFAVILLGVGFLRSSHALSVMQSENARLNAELGQRAEAVGTTPNVEQAAEDGTSTTWVNQLSELNRLRAQVAAFTAREPAFTNLLAQNAALIKKLEQLESESPRQETNRQAVAHIESTAAGRQVPNHSLLSSSTNTSWTQEQIDAYRCANKLLQINIAATLWAQTHEDYAPADLVSLQDYLAPMILICPARRPRSLSVDWRNFDTSAITYQRPPPREDVKWGPGGSRTYTYCPIHQISSFNSPRWIAFSSRYSIHR